jgi:deazaflavin-dependent oxidoreductase (nitroreductase family)
VTIPKSVARFNKKVTNRVTGLFAGWAPGFAILTHRGRRSGVQYRIPINVFRRPGGYRFALTYGSDTDWVKNVLAAGGCSIRTRRRDVILTQPRLGSDPRASWAPYPARFILPRVGAVQYLDCAVAART